jgi:hypothetical protein
MYRTIKILFTIALAVVVTSTGQAQTVTQRSAHLAGTYEGRLPCADCKELRSTLTLTCTSPCTSGTYKLQETYNDRPEGNTIHKQSGTWQLTDNSSASDITIVLDKDKPAKVSYYYLKQDGSLQPLDRKQGSIDNAPFDLTLKKAN